MYFVTEEDAAESDDSVDVACLGTTSQRQYSSWEHFFLFFFQFLSVDCKAPAICHPPADILLWSGPYSEISIIFLYIVYSNVAHYTVQSQLMGN